MATKRQNGDPLESATTTKKTKTDESEFTGTVFKSMLKDSTKALKGLETFVRFAKKLPCAEIYDAVEGYIKISVECSEIFALLEEENNSESEMMLIFQSLEMILLRTASDLSQLSMVGSNIVRKTVSTHMKLLLSSLHSENHRFVRQCLCFLSAVVSQGAEAARDVFSQIHFSKGLISLSRRRDKTGKPDVRMAYIQFVLSFLMSGDNTTIGQILEAKDFLSEILTSGLKEDRLSIVNLILSTLQTRVVQNKTIMKTQKVRFFSPSILGQFASLYKWNGIVDVIKSVGFSTEMKGLICEGKRIVRELVHNFLLDLCSSRKHGISFHDPSLGTAGRAGNIVLLQFLVGLKQATEDEMVAELVVSVLKASPDILTRYFKETNFSFSPRNKSTWLENITLLKKIYEAQPEVSKAFQMSEMIPLPRLLSMVLVTSLPSVCNKAFFTQGLNLPNLVVQHTTISLLAFILKRAQKNIEHCLDKTVWESSDIYSPAVMEEFVQLYREALSKILPDMVSVVSNWQSHSKEKEDAVKTIGTGQKQTRQDDPQLILVKALLLQVMCLYQRVVPHLVSQSKFDFSKLLKGIVTESGMKQEVPPVLQYQILQLALELPASKFSWFRVQDLPDPDPEKGEKSVFYLLLKMFVSSNSNYLKTSTRMLVIKVLWDSGVFEHTWKELELWLDHLALLDPSQQETVIQFLDHVLMRVVCNPLVYTEKAASMVQEAAYLQANLSGQEGDEASIPISHIDDVLDMVDVIVEGSEGDVEEIGPSLTDDIILQTFPFSAIIPAVLEVRNKLPESVVFEYMAAVLCDVLHCQRDPLALCLTLQHYDKKLNTSHASCPPHASVVAFYHYYSQWLPKQTQKTLVSPSHLQGYSNKYFRSKTFGSHCVYLQLPKETAAEVLGSLMTVLNSLILKLLSSETQQPTRPEQQDEADLFLDTNHVPVLLAVLGSVFKHPVVEQWFLALELSSFPPHSLNPVRLKQLCGRLTEMTLTLLESSAAALRELDSLELIGTYLTAAQRAVLKELQEKRSKYVSHHSQVTVFSAYLRNICDPGPQNHSNNALTDIVHLHTLNKNTDVLLHCIQRESPSAQALGVLLLENCSTHVLSFELWCLEASNLTQISSQNSSFLFLLNAYLRRATIDDPTLQQEEVGVATGLHVEVVSGLIRLSAVTSDLTPLMNDLPAILQKTDSNERWKLADSISEKLSDSEELCQWRKSLLSAALLWLSAVYKEQKDPQSHHEETMLTRLKSLLVSQYRYRDPNFLGTLTTLVEVIYGTPETPKELLPMATVHMMTTSHSLFLPTMLSTQDDSDKSLVSLLLMLVKKCPEVCNINHFLVLLGAYGASLSTTDQKILLLLQGYEKNNISLTEFQYVLWGPAAVEHHKARKSLGHSLWQKPSSEQLLSLLTADRMLKTVTHFPQQRYIIPQVEGKHLSSLYDPCFLLPLFSFILRPECAVDCQKFVSSHALGVTVAALSSYDPKVRAAAYQVLGSFHQHLEGARFREKRQVLYLLDTVKNGIPKQNLRMPNVHVAYITKVAQQILRPEEHMYMVVNKFLLGTQFLDLKRVPDFFKLFYSFDLERKLEREWVLSVLEEGVRDKHCYEICEKQGIYQTLLGFASTPLCDQASQIQIVNVLRQTARVNKAAYNLTKEHGVLTWILQLIDKRFFDSKLLSSVIELLHALWFTNLGNKESKPEANSTTSERPQTSGKCLPLPIINEFLCTLLEAGWLTLHPQKLLCSEVLRLLQRWAALARDASLLSALQTLVNKHKVKELMGKCHSAKHAQFRMEKQTETVDGQGEKLEQASLDECKPLLRNILIHWEPKEKEVSSSKPEPFTADKPESSNLDDAAACLILKWALKTLTESPYDNSSTIAVLKWFSSIILPRTSVIDAILMDEGIRMDFLRLYHHTCDHTAQEHGSAVDTLQLFSRVMLRLLEAHSTSLNGIHQMVIRTCLLTNADDGAKRESGLKLLSLYIYELWSGARSPDLLLSHARHLCYRTGIRKPKPHVLRMCEDILSAVES
uniref:Nucleolar pre-ribosomal-associated protein 1 C-terminal domain-containing protein n=1 Tax=Sinocyclocheilus anshuiensis TaxID=1608454 RepID=A0A671SNS2_9TELE